MTTNEVIKKLERCDKYLDKAEMYCSGLEDGRANDMGYAIINSIKSLQDAIDELRIIVEKI
jgi:hypothetical protein